jgi:hypothetical protein
MVPVRAVLRVRMMDVLWADQRVCSTIELMADQMALLKDFQTDRWSAATTETWMVQPTAEEMAPLRAAQMGTRWVLRKAD